LSSVIERFIVNNKDKNVNRDTVVNHLKNLVI